MLVLMLGDGEDDDNDDVEDGDGDVATQRLEPVSETVPAEATPGTET